MPMEMKAQEQIAPKEAAQIRELLKHLPSDHSLRLAALALLEDRPVRPNTAPDVMAVLQAPHPERWQEQTLAVWLLGRTEWQPEGTTTARRRMLTIVGDWKLRNTRQRMTGALEWAILSGMFTLPLLTCVKWFSKHEYVLLLACGLVTGVLWLAALPILALRENDKIAYVRAAAIFSLGRLQAVEGVGTLAEACIEDRYGLSLTPARYRNDVRGKARWALLQTLPHVTEADYGRLPASTVPNLCRLLEHINVKATLPANEMLTRAVLEALGEIGDGRAVATVKRLAVEGESETIRSKAAEILPVLQARQQQERATQTLLRPAEATITPDTLLRAATTDAANEAVQLLRANVPE